MQARFIDRRGFAENTQPEVSVIMPIYNAMPYLKDAVESVLRQNEVRVELICIDDGSTDGSVEFLLSHLEHPSLNVILQDNSGSPSSPRNRGLDLANGEFVYFLDSDDLLYEGALSNMVAAARKTGNDHVLGKIKGIGGRNAMPQIFRKTVLNAGLLSNYAWHNLSPTGKLVRKDLIDRLSLRFPEDQWIGEDQVFFSELYLSGSGISILSDQDYVGIRYKAEGTNITSRQQKLADKQKTLCRVAAVITKHCADGYVRDKLAQRLFTSTMLGVFDGVYQVADPVDQALFLKALHDQVTPLYGGAIEHHVVKKIAVLLSLIKQGKFREVDDIIAWFDDRGVQYVMRENRLIVELPDLKNFDSSTVNLEVPRAGILRPELTSIDKIQGNLYMTETVSVAQVTTNPCSVDLVLRERRTGDEVILPAHTFSGTTDGNALKIEVTFEVPSTLEIPRGAWGTFIRCTWGLTQTETRCGHRTAGIPNEKHYFEIANSTPAIAYFNSGYENLTIDVDHAVHDPAEI
ncbi:hypothetical protein HMPREF2736_06590 [Corynebacterium sp. HMSC036E10]|nr:hypothetical protein HMPREF2736_06590 [Corynebacterium sp. HMSC036E10]